MAYCMRRYMCAITALVLLLISMHSDATEVLATNEWTLLGENDTVDAGMHIRIDLEKGQKWVKQLDNKIADVSFDGAMVLSTESSADSPQHEASPTQQEKAKVGELNYDFDMMYRTLSRLPPEEKERIALPESVPSKSMSPEARIRFEAQMKEIWLARQTELNRIQEEELADLPTILKDRIQQIRDYLKDPIAGMMAIDEDRDSDRVGDILAVLKDLEYHVSDIDMARDFYTLNGWPLLVALLSEDVHQGNHRTESIRNQLSPKVDTLQSYAAWTIGTAVKNHEEFNSYAIDPVALGGHATTAMDLILEQTIELTQTPIVRRTQERKLHKFLYALGSMLRGNRDAQSHFCAADGPRHLGEILVKSLDSENGRKVVTRLLSLADDIVTDTQLHRGKSEQVDQAIAMAFTTGSWCDAAVRALQDDSSLMDEVALKTFRTLSTYCDWKTFVIDGTLTNILETWKLASTDDIDPLIQQERIEVVEKIVHDATA